MIESSERVTTLLQGRFGFVHNPVDIGETSAALRVYHGALTSAEPPGGLNLFHDQRAAVSNKILPDVFGRIFKTIADQIFHAAFFLSLYAIDHCAVRQRSDPFSLTATSLNQTLKSAVDPW